METRNILSLLGLAYRGRNLESGETPVLAAIRDKKARLLLVSSDFSERARIHLQAKLSETVPLLALPFDKLELGKALGKSSCSMIAITDAGFSLILLRELDPENAYPETVKKLEGIKYRKSLREKERRSR